MGTICEIPTRVRHVVARIATKIQHDLVVE